MHKLALRNLEIHPRRFGEECGVLTPDDCCPVLEGNVNILVTLGPAAADKAR
jgi:hypothetical protein